MTPDGPLAGRVSVLVPARDEEERIPVALRSIRGAAQGAEIVVVDDGSRDRTADVVRAGFPEVRVVSVQRGGIARALNAGLEAVSTPFVARADADDECLPERFERQHARLCGEPDAVLCACGHVEVTDDWERRFAPPADPEQMSEELLRRNVIAHGTVMFRRDAVMDVGGYDPSAEPAEDYDLWLRLLSEGNLVGVPDVLYRRSPPQGAELRRKRRRQARASAAVQWRHFRRTGRMSPWWLGRNLVGGVWPGPRPAHLRMR